MNNGTKNVPQKSHAYITINNIFHSFRYSELLYIYFLVVFISLKRAFKFFTKFVFYITLYLIK